MESSADKRRFPPPWTVERSRQGNFTIKDANGLPLAHVYSRDDLHASGGSIAQGHLTSDEARRIAAAIARVPEFLLDGRQFVERGRPQSNRWKLSHPFHIALRDSFVRQHYDYIVAMCRYNDVPFDATGEKIEREGVWRVYQFSNRVDAMMFWAQFEGRWLLGEDFHYPQRLPEMPRMKKLKLWEKFQTRDNGWL